MRCSSNVAWLPRLAATLCAALLACAAFAADPPGVAAQPPPRPIPVFHGTAKVALEAATLDASPVLLAFFGNSPDSVRLRDEVLHSAEFRQQGGALQIAEVNANTDPTLARAFGVRTLPALVLVTAEERIVARHEGFFHTAELMLWLREARQRLAEGKWEGTLPGAKASAFATRAATGRLGAADVEALVQLLSEADPADRAAAAQLIATLREQAVPALIGAITNNYLGTRIAASELLHDLAPDAPPADPWLSPAELSDAAAALREWWAKARKLPPATALKADPATLQSIQGALDALRGGEPLARTEALALLVRHGKPALASVRNAIRLCEKNGDHRTITLLEEARWAILVPDSLEKAAGGVRYALARGKTQERQAASVRLGRAGRPALDALVELANDPDAMVVESAVRALSTVGGADAIPAMAALLNANDSNLRMTAAQALGKTRNPQAIPALLPATEDLNEVVACAALAAIEEINAAREYSSRKTHKPEVTQAVKKALSDPRWRVRATAAEVVGKMEMKELAADLKPLISDPDGFVVKGALESLSKLEEVPEPEQLLEVARRLPGLRAEAIQSLITMGAAKPVTDLYSSGGRETREEILRGISLKSVRISDQPGKSGLWKPLLARAATEPDPALRRLAAQVLASQAFDVTTAIIQPLLTDEDAAVREAAAATLVLLVGGEKQVLARPTASSGQLDSMDSQIQNILDAGEDLDLPSVMGSVRNRKTNAPAYDGAALARWHQALKQKAGPAPGLATAMALFVTDTNALDALPMIEAALARATAGELEELASSKIPSVLLPRLSWPEGRSLTERLTALPEVFLRVLPGLPGYHPSLRADWLEPARFVARVDGVRMGSLAKVLDTVIDARGYGWSLGSGLPETVPMLEALSGATNPVWRAVSLFLLARLDDPQYLPLFGRGLQDPNPWVRLQALNALGSVATNQAALQAEAVRLLDDPDVRVSVTAASWLLPPETRSEIDPGTSRYFVFDQIHAGYSFDSDTAADQRPLMPITPAPGFVAAIRQKAAAADLESLAVFSVVLAQYGDTSGLDRLLTVLPEGDAADPFHVPLLTAIALTRDPRYLPQIRRIMAADADQWELRRLLKAIRGVTGPDARGLRVEINRRLRAGKENEI